MPSKVRLFLMLGVLILVSLGCGSHIDVHPVDELAPPDEPYTAWTFKTRAPIVMTPVLKNDKLYISAMDRRVYQVDLPSSKIKWDQKFDTFVKYLAVPDDSLFFVATAPPEGSIQARHRDNRDEEWTRKLGTVHADLMTTDSLLFASTSAKRFFALKRATGTTAWDYELTDFCHTTPVVRDSLVIFSTDDGHIIALNSTDGQEVWRYEHPAALTVEPYFDGEVLIYIAENDDILRLDPAEGTIVWKTTVKGSAQNPPVRYQDQMMISSLTGSCDFLAIDTGDIVQTMGAPKLMTPPTVFENYLIFVGQEAGEISIIDARTQQQVWQKMLNQTVRATSLIWNQHLLIGTTDKELHAINLAPLVE